MKVTAATFFNNQDQKYKDMKDIIRRCNKLGISIPKEITETFKSIGIDDFESNGFDFTNDIFPVGEYKTKGGFPFRLFETDICTGTEIIIDKIPREYKVIKIVHKIK